MGIAAMWRVQGFTSELLGHLLGKVVHHEFVKPAVIVLLLLCKWVLQAISATQHSPDAMQVSYPAWLMLVLVRGRDDTAPSSPSYPVFLETLLLVHMLCRLMSVVAPLSRRSPHCDGCLLSVTGTVDELENCFYYLPGGCWSRVHGLSTLGAMQYGRDLA